METVSKITNRRDPQLCKRLQQENHHMKKNQNGMTLNRFSKVIKNRNQRMPVFKYLAPHLLIAHIAFGSKSIMYI